MIASPPLLLSMVAACWAQAGPAATAGDLRAARIARFDRFLVEAMTTYRRAGAARTGASGRFGYADADLINPLVVTDEQRHVLERYDSYRALLKAAAPSPVKADAFAKPAGSTTPEDHVRGVGDGKTDATAAIEEALSVGDVWLTPGRRYAISHALNIPPHRRISSDGTGTIVALTDRPGFPDIAFSMAQRYRGYSNVITVHDVDHVVLQDFRLQTPIASGQSPQPLLHGIDIQNAAHVAVAGLELRGFARTQGVLRVNSSTDVTLADNLIHGSYTRQLTRQVTGIEIDEARVADGPNRPARSSEQVAIVGNFIFGLLMDPRVYLDTTLRQGSALNDETTGIQLASKGSAATIRVDDNVMADVGQGLDLFVSDGHFSRNIIERAPEFALKIGHGASRNSFDDFKIIASGLAAVVIYGSPDEPVIGNRINRMTIDHPGAVVGLPGAISTAVLVSLNRGADGGAPTAANNMSNQFNDIRITGMPPAATASWRGAIVCGWPAGTRPGDAAPNLFHGVRPQGVAVMNKGGCAMFD